MRTALRRARGGILLAVAGMALASCTDGDGGVIDPGFAPAAPVDLEAVYFNRAVFLTWELAPDWDGESFRVYGRRASAATYLLLAEVTSCTGGLCNYTDRNISANQAYTYYVAAYDSRSGQETASAFAVDVNVPSPTPPPVPSGLDVVSLDNAVYLKWNANARSAQDFSFYRVYVEGEDGDFLLGETDSEGFMDLLVENGNTYTYRLSSVDDLGHESTLGSAASGTPRPDYSGEILYAFEDVPAEAGFRFVESEATLPIVSGTSSSRHVRLEVDDQGWWLVPAPGVQLYPQGFETTALACGPWSNVDCVALEVAPTSGYSTQDLSLVPQTTYVVRYPQAQGFRYGAIRVTLQGFDQTNAALMIFDWSHQLQVGNPNLAPRTEAPILR